MLDDGLPFLGPKIDLYQIDPITPRRTLTFINYFVSQTTNFLNRFAMTCEEKLDDLGLRIQNMEVLMTILETKIASIPGLQDVTMEIPQPAQEARTKIPGDAEVDASPPTPIKVSGSVVDGNNIVLKADNTGKMLNKDNPKFKKYFKLLSMGVQSAAVKQKMMMDNIDPSILEDPNGLSQEPNDEDQNDSDDSGSSFDDDCYDD